MTSTQNLYEAEEYDLESFENILPGWTVRRRKKLRSGTAAVGTNGKDSVPPRPRQKVSEVPGMTGRSAPAVNAAPAEEFVLDERHLSTFLLFDVPVSSSKGRRPPLSNRPLRTVSILDALNELAGEASDCRHFRHKETVHEVRRSLPPDLDILAATAETNGSAVNGEDRAGAVYPNTSTPVAPPPRPKGKSSRNLELQRKWMKRNRALFDTTSPAEQPGVKLPSDPPAPASLLQSSKTTPVTTDTGFLAKLEPRGPMQPRALLFTKGRTPEWIQIIFDIVRKGQTERLRQALKDMDATLLRNLSDHHGNNLFHACASSGHLDCLQVLLAQGKQCEEALRDENKHGLTPAIVAVKNGNLSCVEWLLKKTISKEQLLPQDGSRPLLHWAAKYGQMEILKWLLEFMASSNLDINSRDKEGNTALHLAARYGHAPCIKILVERQCDLCLENDHGYKPFDTAFQYGQVACSEYLLSLETCSLLASDISSLEQDLHSLRNESIEMKNHFREVLCCAKKLMKEREEISRELELFQGTVIKLNDKMIMELQVLEKENSTLREKLNGGRKKEVSEEHVGTVIEQCNTLHRRWQEEQKRLFSPSWLTEAEQKLIVAEEKWRRARPRLVRVPEPCRQPFAIFSERLTQARWRGAGAKLGESRNLSSSESSLTSVGTTDDFERAVSPTIPAPEDPFLSADELTRHSTSDFLADVFPQELKGSSSHLAGCEERGCTRRPAAQMAGRRGRFPNRFDFGELKRVKSAPQINQSPKPPSLVKFPVNSLFGDTGLAAAQSAAHHLQDLGGLGESTCSVIEIIEPSNSDSEGRISKDQDNRATKERDPFQGSEPPYPARPRLPRRNNPLEGPEPPSGNASCGSSGAKNNGNSQVSANHNETNDSADSDTSNSNPEADQTSSAPEESHGAQSDSQAPQEEECRIISEANETVDKHCSGPLMSPEPDLIRGTKGIRTYEDISSLTIVDSVDNVIELVPDSDHIADSEDGGDIVITSSEGSLSPSRRPRVLQTSSQSSEVTQETSVPQLAPGKKIGFLQKIALRWPSKRKVKNSQKKSSNEITPEDFRETYLHTRSSSGDLTEMQDAMSEDHAVDDGESSSDEQGPSSSSQPSGQSLECIVTQADDISCSHISKEELPEDSELPNRYSSSQSSGREPPFPPEIMPRRSVGLNLSQEDGGASNAEAGPSLVTPAAGTATSNSIFTLSDLASRSEKDKTTPFQLCLTSSKDTDCQSSRVSSLSLSQPEESLGESVPRPASSASKSEPLPRPESSASRTDLSSFKAAGFPLRKASSVSTDLLPDSSTTSRMSPAPSEVSKTESALLSPPSDVSKTESVRHLRQLGRIEEIVNREPVSVLPLRKAVEVKRANILEISKDGPTGATDHIVNVADISTATKANTELPAVNSPRTSSRQEKPWYDVSDDEDMLTPERLQRTGIRMRNSSEDEEESFLHSG